MSSRKYHISPETGRPNQCTATVRGCKYAENGEIPEHYETKEEAREAYAKKMDAEVGAVKSFKKDSRGRINIPEFPKFNSATAAPTDFDGVYNAMLEKQNESEYRKFQAFSVLQSTFNDKVYNRKTYQHEYVKDPKEVLKDVLERKDLNSKELAIRDSFVKAQELDKKNRTILAQLDSTYKNRGEWNRAFVVPEGHVHKSMNCSTCNKGEEPTKFQLLNEYSGSNEGEIVMNAGYRACTTCYPSAPVGDSTALPTKMFSDEEKKKATARVERAAAKEAKKVEVVSKAATLSGEPLKVKTGLSSFPETFKTERSALNWYMNSATNGKIKDESKESVEKNARYTVLYNLALKHDKSIGELQEELHKKALVKSKKDYKESLKYFDELKRMNPHSLGDMKPSEYEEPVKDDYGIPEDFLNKSPREWGNGDYIPK